MFVGLSGSFFLCLPTSLRKNILNVFIFCFFETLTPPKVGREEGGKNPWSRHLRDQDVICKSPTIWRVTLEAYQEVKRTFDKIGRTCSILSNQTQFPLCSFATAPSICHISDCDHRICKNTEQFSAPASSPSVPWVPYGVKLVCISPPGNQLINFSLIYPRVVARKKSLHRL